MKMWAEQLKSTAARKLAAAVLAIAIVGALVTFEFAGSAHAAANLTKPAPAAAALDDNSCCGRIYSRHSRGSFLHVHPLRTANAFTPRN